MNTYTVTEAHRRTVVFEGKKTAVKRFLKAQPEPNEYDVLISGGISREWGESFLENPSILDKHPYPLSPPLLKEKTMAAKTDKLERQLVEKMQWYGIDMSKYKLYSIEYDSESGHASWVHKENNTTLPYAERRLECGVFYFDKKGDLLKWKTPVFS